MVELSTRDLLVLYAIIEWNKSVDKATVNFPRSAKASAMQPCTVTVLINNYINTLAQREGLTDRVSHTEQVYRSVEALDKAGLVCIIPFGRRHQYTSTPNGRKLMKKLNSPKDWPNKVEVDGDKFHIYPSLAAR